MSTLYVDSREGALAESGDVILSKVTSFVGNIYSETPQIRQPQVPRIKGLLC